MPQHILSHQIRAVKEMLGEKTKKFGKFIQFKLAGGKYGRRQEQRFLKTPQGQKLKESLETHGFFGTQRRIKKGEFNE